jgi:hypothetical protein
VKQSELVALQQQLSTALARVQMLESKVATLESKPTTTIVSEKNTARGVPATVTCSAGVVVNCINRSNFVSNMTK